MLGSPVNKGLQGSVEHRGKLFHTTHQVVVSVMPSGLHVAAAHWKWVSYHPLLPIKHFNFVEASSKVIQTTCNNEVVLGAHS